MIYGLQECYNFINSYNIAHKKYKLSSELCNQFLFQYNTLSFKSQYTALNFDASQIQIKHTPGITTIYYLILYVRKESNSQTLYLVNHFGKTYSYL